MIYLYWPLVWVTMILAFIGAWIFLVKGCEFLDATNPPEHETEADAGH